jgi:uncharacterized membrane protein YeaQ/YmgE (transglycosylase-associated protein family)
MIKMAEEKIKSLFDSESVSVVAGAIIGGLSLKLIPASYVASLGKWTGIVFGVIGAVIAYFTASHKEISKFFVGFSVFTFVDGLFMAFVPSLAL